MLHEIRVSGTVLWSPAYANSPTYTYISQKRGSGNRVSDFRVSGGPPVQQNRSLVRKHSGAIAFKKVLRIFGQNFDISAIVRTGGGTAVVSSYRRTVWEYMALLLLCTG